MLTLLLLFSRINIIISAKKIHYSSKPKARYTSFAQAQDFVSLHSSWKTWFSHIHLPLVTRKEIPSNSHQFADDALFEPAIELEVDYWSNESIDDAANCKESIMENSVLILMRWIIHLISQSWGMNILNLFWNTHQNSAKSTWLM